MNESNFKGLLTMYLNGPAYPRRTREALMDQRRRAARRRRIKAETIARLCPAQA